MDYQQTLDWMFSRLPMYQRIGKAAYKADLFTTIDLLDKLGNPQERFKAIHVAGTNGKGSVCHLLASILQEAGYKTGLYTSPHLKDFRERIRINGEMISEKKVVDFIEKNKPLFEEVKPSFFEMTVAMAFEYFANEQVDFAVLETGMGGRLDSTNISAPILTVITNIGYDHLHFLGDTIEKIAGEKAGIIKKGIPLVVGKKQEEARQVFEKIASDKNVPVFYADEHFDLKEIHTTERKKRIFDVWDEKGLFMEHLESPLLANYQKDNLKTVFQSIRIFNELNDEPIDKETIRSGISDVLENTGLQGRWQIIGTFPLTICDTAHNPEGIQAIVDQIYELSFKHLHFVFGMVNDKDPQSILYLLPKNATYYFCKPDIPRGMDADELKQHAFKAGLRGESYNSVTLAFNSAINNAGSNDLVFVGGSTFVVAEVI
ncbi:MAG: bifunctional folylpolyglutamate synthase/dihydrofolate synthase [Chlorobi bacterium]|nr:bifunctional folylpolyglutamate synthase/dihydrofolate synthase [Chlorobiota bacterium]